MQRYINQPIDHRIYELWTTVTIVEEMLSKNDSLAANRKRPEALREPKNNFREQ